MGYDIYFHHPDGTPAQIDAARLPQGGTYQVAGEDDTVDAWLNITFNYTQIYERENFRMTDIHGLTARETLSMIQPVAYRLTDLPSSNY